MQIDDSTIEAIDNLTTNQGAFFVLLLLITVALFGMIWLMYTQSRSNARREKHESENETLRLNLQGQVSAREADHLNRALKLQETQQEQVGQINESIHALVNLQKANDELANEWRKNQTETQLEFQKGTSETLKTIAYALSDFNQSYRQDMTNMKGSVDKQTSLSADGFRIIRRDLITVKKTVVRIEKRMENLEKGENNGQ